ncbi:putative tRNA-splicing endonuclease subunit sen54 [Talaromyces islandicus]|uniref:Putative tRNA-splicing endonuclease subunit sen54 n=1 Tax=Talaromyces islandicus TaxID=28573 RepID=A0A0U1LLQ3_TALIS|nr:putative tRNA-splicing endonuclease subunit sen54 [Talaromyces islandicus]
MADVDEDAIPRPAPGGAAPQAADTDLSDEVQDFRFLNSLSIVNPDDSPIPRRGEKDFEPNPTELQSDVLSASRRAMHNAISHPRLHGSKTHIIGVYAPEGPTPLEIKIKEPAQTNEGDEPAKPAKVVKDPMSGIPADSCVYVPNPKGVHFKATGKTDRWNRVWLLPEEALYYLERGTIDIRWPVSITAPLEEGNEQSGLPMSLQAAYACFIGRAGLTLERYSVYTGLRRSGYTILRAPSWYGDQGEDDSGVDDEIEHGPSFSESISNSWNRLYSSVYNLFEKDYSEQGPLIGLNIHHSYNNIFRKLAIIPVEPVGQEKPRRRQTEAPFQFAYHVYKPSTPFKKTAPPEPDFRIAVVDARTQTTIPTLSQLRALVETSPLTPPTGGKMQHQLYVRLRHGYRSAILAVVDQGIVSYLRFTDAGFSKEKLYEIQGPPRGNKGGFRGKGVQIIRRHQQLQTQLWRNIHIRNIALFFIFLVVAKIFADFFEHHATVQAYYRTQRPVTASEKLPTLKMWDELLGSSIRRIVPETHAVLRGRTNSKPSLETSVTYSAAAMSGYQKMVKEEEEEHASRVKTQAQFLIDRSLRDMPSTTPLLFLVSTGIQILVEYFTMASRPSTNLFRHIEHLRSPTCLHQAQLTRRARISSTATATKTRRLSTPAHSKNTAEPRLAERTALITGGSSGIGYAIAERFLQEGARRVILVGRRRERLQDAADQLMRSLTVSQGDGDDINGQVATRMPEEDRARPTIPEDRIQLLVGDISTAKTWAGELEKEMANVDILINAAGVSLSNLLAKTPPDDISQTLQTNLEGAILASRALLRACIRARAKSQAGPNQNGSVRSRSIINISSLLALKGITGTAAYAASKAGLLGLTSAMAVEAAEMLKGSKVVLRSNAIVPGYIQTPMVENFSEDHVNSLHTRIPLNRFGDPREVADAAVFLATNEYANNCILNLDGGLSAV